MSQEIDSTNDDRVLVAWLESSSDPFIHLFYVSSSQLPSKVQWKPDELFPVDLGSEAERAKEQLTTRLRTNDFYPESIRISHGFTGSEWVVDFRFFPKPPAMTNLYVEMLLDGTYAEEHVRSKTKSETLFDEETKRKLSGELEPPRRFMDTPGTNTFRPTPHIDARTNASDLVRLPDFVIPQVQWKWGEPFPVDLGAGAAQARACLTDSNSFVLREICVSQYVPDGARGSSPEAIINNLHHWYMEYYFTSSDEKVGYFVYMLLDRRILCVSNRDP